MVVPLPIRLFYPQNSLKPLLDSIENPPEPLSSSLYFVPSLSDGICMDNIIQLFTMLPYPLRPGTPNAIIPVGTPQLSLSKVPTIDGGYYVLFGSTGGKGAISVLKTD